MISYTYEQALAYIDEIPKFTVKHSNEHTQMLLKKLGNPEEKFKVIHVAGSNGKGSVCMMIYHGLLTNDKKACGFFSPHLVDIRERFMLSNHQMCSKEAFLEAFHQVMTCIEGEEHPSYFEFLFLMGMLIFQQDNAEYIVLETGLGGRLDATNSVKAPVMNVITSISLEHTEYLGNTIAEIAAEKAGIIKPGAMLVYDSSNKDAGQVICQTFEKVNSVAGDNSNLPRIFPVNIDRCSNIQFRKKSISYTLEDEVGEGLQIEIPFVAQYQVINSALAATALKLLLTDENADLAKTYVAKTDIDKTDIAEALRTVYWPGRMEEIAPGIFLDGAHNADGISNFLQTVKRMNESPAVLLFSMVKDKDYEKAVEYIAGYDKWDQIAVTHIPSERGIQPEILAESFSKRGIQVQVIEDYKEAFDRMRACKRENQLMFATGSLYFVGAIKEALAAVPDSTGR